MVQCVRVCVSVCRPPCGVPASGLVFPLHPCYVYVEICMCGACIWSLYVECGVSYVQSLYVETVGGLHYLSGHCAGEVRVRLSMNLSKVWFFL